MMASQKKHIPDQPEKLVLQDEKSWTDSNLCQDFQLTSTAERFDNKTKAGILTGTNFLCNM